MTAKKTFLASSSIALGILVVLVILSLNLVGNSQAYATESPTSPVVIQLMASEDSLLLIAVGNNNDDGANLYVVALLDNQSYTVWKTQEPHNSSNIYGLPPSSILAKNVSSFTTFKRIFGNGDYYLIIVRTQGSAPINYFFATAPYGFVFAISLFGFVFSLLSFIAFVSGTIALIRFLIELGDKKKRQQQTNPPLATPSSSASKSRETKEESNKTFTQEAPFKNAWLRSKDAFEQIYIRISTEEMVLIILGLTPLLFLMFNPEINDVLPLYGSFLLIAAGPLLLASALILYTVRTKQRKDLVSYLQIRRKASISELEELISADTKQVRRLVLDAVRIDGVNIEIDDEFQYLRLVETPSSAVTNNVRDNSGESVLSEASSISRCPFCAAETSSDSLFCSQCGASLIPPK